MEDCFHAVEARPERSRALEGLFGEGGVGEGPVEVGVVFVGVVEGWTFDFAGGKEAERQVLGGFVSEAELVEVAVEKEAGFEVAGRGYRDAYAGGFVVKPHALVARTVGVKHCPATVFF